MDVRTARSHGPKTRQKSTRDMAHPGLGGLAAAGGLRDRVAGAVRAAGAGHGGALPAAAAATGACAGPDRECRAAPGGAPGPGLGAGERRGNAADRAAARAGAGGVGGAGSLAVGVSAPGDRGSGLRHFEQARTALSAVCTAAFEDGYLVEHPVRMRPGTR